MNEEQKFWDKIHQTYVNKGYDQKPSIFAEEFAKILLDQNAKRGRILELGAGLGQDGDFFKKLGFSVVSTDLNKSKGVEQLDMREFPWRFSDAEFDIVYAHLSLHYFDDKTTKKIFSEIYRVLKEDGIIAFLVNSKSDPEYDKNEEAENGLLKVGSITKRYFDVEMAQGFAKGFVEVLADNNGETYKDKAKGIHNLIRYAGRKDAK